MLTASTPVVTAIAGNAYDYIARVVMTIPGGYGGASVTGGPYGTGTGDDVGLSVTSLTIDSSTTTDMPAGTRYAAGYPAVSCDFTLAGIVDPTASPVLTAAALFGPYQTGSPLYRRQIIGTAVTVDVAVLAGTSTVSSPEWLRKFTGTVDSFIVDPVAGTVQFTCADYRNRLRSIPETPPVVTVPAYNAGLTSEFAVDYVLRAATNYGISTWPAPRANCVLAAGLRASLWPEVGKLNTTDSQPDPQFSQSGYGSGLSGFDTDNGTLLTGTTWDLASAPTTDVMVECFVSGIDPATGGSAGIAVGDVIPVSAADPTLYVAGMQVQIDQTGVNTYFGGAPQTLSTTPAAGTHYVAVHVHYNSATTTWSGTIWFDGTSQAFSTTSGDPVADRPSGWSSVSVAFVHAGAAVSGLQVTTETSPASNGGFVPTAYLDESLNTLQVVPELSGDPWQVLQSIADAELAVAGFDEFGVFRFTNRDTLHSSPAVRTVTAAESLKTVTIESSAASQANHVQVPYTAWVYQSAGLVFTLQDKWKVPRHSTFSWIITLDTLAVSTDGTGAVLPNSHATSDGNTWYRASTTAAGATAHPGPLTVTVRQLSSSTVVVTVVNGAGSDAWLVSPAVYTDVSQGDPALWIGGLPVIQAGEVTADWQYPDAANGGAASGPFGDVAVALSSNAWIQDQDSAQTLAQDLGVDMYTQRPDLTQMDIVPDPTLQLMDRVRITDPDVSGVDEYAVIWGQTLTLDGDQGMSHQIDARTTTAPGLWILGVTGRSELGVTTYV